jgi:hypothetical protein
MGVTKWATQACTIPNANMLEGCIPYTLLPQLEYDPLSVCGQLTCILTNYSTPRDMNEKDMI